MKSLTETQTLEKSIIINEEAIMNNQAITHGQQWLNELMAAGLTLNQIAKETRLSQVTLRLVIKDASHTLNPMNFKRLFHYYLAMTTSLKN